MLWQICTHISNIKINNTFDKRRGKQTVSTKDERTEEWEGEKDVEVSYFLYEMSKEHLLNLKHAGLHRLNVQMQQRDIFLSSLIYRSFQLLEKN